MSTNSDLTLRDVAQRAVDRNGGKGGRALDRVAKERGLTLSYTTIDKILGGTYRSRPGRATLEALSVLAGVRLEAVYQAANLPMPMESLADQLPPDADLLTGPQRDAVLAVVRQFAAANRALHSVDGPALSVVGNDVGDQEREDVAAYDSEGSIEDEQEATDTP